ncbi:hypothetical protein [Bacillus phage PK16]|nr:hypothetical protein [Bacillus phage PK16]AUM58955.1 hypothetical protein BCP01_154 [Bacillus phage BCP01]
MNLKKKDIKNTSAGSDLLSIFLYSVAIIAMLLFAAIVALLFACIPMGIVWFVLVGVLGYAIPLRIIFWIVYVLTLVLVIVMAIED